MDMVKICPKCHRTMGYDPYFQSYHCKQCGNQEPVNYKDQFPNHKEVTRGKETEMQAIV